MEFIDHSPENTELAKALLKVQQQMSPAARDGKNPFTKSNYATLNSVMESCRSALLNNNIWLCQYPVPIDRPDCLGLMTKLTHTESGQWQASLTIVPLPKADPQGMGSAITYARRYAITAMLGMSTEDDDGESAKAIVRNNYSHGSHSGKSSNNHQTNDEGVPIDDDWTNGLPDLDGVSYKYATATDGRQCIIALGNTHPQKELLRGAGFVWNAQRKMWWKYAEEV